MRKSALLFIIVLLNFCTIGQDQQLLLKSGTYNVETSSLDWREDELVDGHFFRIITFQQIPTSDDKRRLEAEGIALIQYLPKNSYYAKVSSSIDWSNTDTMIVQRIERDYKLTYGLLRGDYPHWTLFGENQIELNAFLFDGIDRVSLQSKLDAIPALVVSEHLESNRLHLRIQIAALDKLYALNEFYYFESPSPPETPENDRGRTSHRSNVLWSEYTGGLDYSGDGVTVMMQDDGYIGEHIDYTGRTDQSNCGGCSSSEDNDHGDHVAGTIMGAGNIDPKMRGMAHGVDLLVYSSNNDNYNDVPSLYDNENMVITSKSYSDGCNVGYSGLTQQLDQQVRERPNLTHVFSAGNTGGDDCGYGAGAGWGNITGGHKSGKNVIAVGNLTYTDGLASSSSRGPATDGRIKPDICGVGTNVSSTVPGNTYEAKTGTSMSCPGVAGTIAQLYEAYRDLNGGADPHAALIKATVLNTAEDLLNKGPDFKTGWGRINARRAYEVLNDQSYFYNSIDQGGSNQHLITVPPGVEEVRIMVYWTDYEGSTSASIALVNDINMIVTDPALTTWEPWVLDHTPDATALDAPAIRATDSLNNVEQVTLENPMPGIYTVDLDGFAIPEGPQDYYLVYYFVRNEISVTYPIGGEGIDPDASEIVRWDASAGTDDFTLEYTDNDGASWNPIGTVNPDLRHYAWSVPDITTGLAKIRVSRNGNSGESESVFTIIDTPENLRFEWICPDSAKLVWDTVPAAIGYEVSQLGAKYMDSITTTTQTSLVLMIDSAVDTWFSVRSLGPDGARGERAIALHKEPGEYNCTWSAPHADLVVDCSSAGTARCFNFTSTSVNMEGSSDYLWYFPGGTPATSTLENPQVCYSAAGNYDVSLVVTNGVGTDSIYLSAYLDVLLSQPLPYFDGFEAYGNFNTIDEWSVENPGNNQAFIVTTVAPLSGARSGMLFNFGQPAGNIDELISGPIDLSLSASDPVTLTFRYAYRKRSDDDMEWLKVFISKGCGGAWAQRKTLFGDLLSPLFKSTFWQPNDETDWTTVHVTNITSNYYSGDFRFKFVFESDGGNNFFLDNINLYEGSPSDDLVLDILEESAITHFSLFPNPAQHEITIAFNLAAAQLTTLSVTDPTGKRLFTTAVMGATGSNLAVIDVSEFVAGVYFLEINEGGSKQLKRFVIQ